jgi:hypothetical protein
VNLNSAQLQLPALSQGLCSSTIVLLLVRHECTAPSSTVVCLLQELQSPYATAYCILRTSTALIARTCTQVCAATTRSRTTINVQQAQCKHEHNGLTQHLVHLDNRDCVYRSVHSGCVENAVLSNSTSCAAISVMQSLPVSLVGLCMYNCLLSTAIQNYQHRSSNY